MIKIQNCKLRSKSVKKTRTYLKVGIRCACILAAGTICMLLLRNGAIKTEKSAADGRTLTSEVKPLEDLNYQEACEYNSYPQYYVPVGQGVLTCDALENGAFVLLVLGIMYMFLALAIVCDEFFVPSLEVMGEILEMSDDVAGATLMAAGGSAPELFTSFLGVFIVKNDVGFGTIVGSAVFNVLFVIGMCAVFSKEVLVLSWWPLARDCSYYTISLTVLALFFQYHAGESTDPKGPATQIMMWEALVLFLMYIGYVVLMFHNEKLHEKATQWLTGGKTQESKGSEAASPQDISIEVEAEKRPLGMAKLPSFVRPSTFRAGVLKLLISDKSILETAGIHVVSSIQGNARETFKKVAALCLGEDSSPDTMNIAEFKVMLADLGSEPDPSECQKAFDTIDTNKNGQISCDEFCDWYRTSEQRLVAERKRAFELIDSDHNGHIDKEELRVLLSLLEVNVSDEDVDAAMATLDVNNDQKISEEEFADWFDSSLFFQERVRELSSANLVEEEESGGFPEWPAGESISAKILYIVTFPIIAILYGTLPHMGNENSRKYYIFTFLGSILWIGTFSYFMVWWAVVTGDALGIPPEVMGLTFLAAGTSVPDLLSSVIVAQQGKGDMAVSSSIGSNIFDVLVGLPVPWLLYTLINGTPIDVESKSLGLSIVILILMLILVITTIAACKWRMTKTLGGVMFMLYVVFVVQDLIRVFSEKKSTS